MRAVAAAAAAAAIAVLVGAITALAGPGDPNRSFGGDGIARLPDSDTRLLGAAKQRDGKLVAVGEIGREAGAVRLLVARFTRAGQLDRSFNRRALGPSDLLGLGEGGTFVGPVGSSAEAARVLGSGKILVAGSRTERTGTSTQGMLLMRLRSNGSPDRSFSGDGTALALTGAAGAGRALALAGRTIVVAGSATLGARSDGYPRLAVARFTASGSRDRRFGSRGQAVLDFGRFSAANGVAVRDGRIVLAGSVRDDLQSTSLLAARLTGRGRPDRRFSGDGLFVRQYARGGAYSAAFDLALAGRGKVLIAGVANNDSTGVDALAIRLRRGGGPDRRFSGDGAAYLTATSDRDTFSNVEPLPGAQGLAQLGRRIVLGGHFDELGRKRLALWALKPNGSIDRRFGTRGRSLGTVSGGSAQLSDIARAPGGGLYGVGYLSDPFEPTVGLAAGYR